jgi:uncharacterized Zn-binding protein involved in type VI secretion
MKFAAKLDDKVIGVDTHLVKIPAGYGYVIVPLPHPYIGNLKTSLSNNVLVQDKKAATIKSISIANPKHTPQGAGFVRNPDNKGEVVMGSNTVLINGKKAARNLDAVSTCDDMTSRPMNRNSKIVCTSTVIIGD